jgi:hypothetical protein
MKKFLIPVMTIASYLFSQSVQAQNCPEKSPVSWACNKGYWVVESNKDTPREAVIYFYNNNHKLVGREEWKNQRLKLGRKKTLEQLKTSLEQAMARYEKESGQIETVSVKLNNE